MNRWGKFGATWAAISTSAGTYGILDYFSTVNNYVDSLVKENMTRREALERASGLTANLLGYQIPLNYQLAQGIFDVCVGVTLALILLNRYRKSNREEKRPETNKQN